MAITRRQCDKKSLLRNRDHRWHFWMLANTMTTYIKASTDLGQASGGLNVPGSVVVIDKWLQEAHGPSVIVKDASWVQPSFMSTNDLALDIELAGLDVFGDPLKVRMMGLNGKLPDTGAITNVSVVDGGGGYGDIYRLAAGFTWEQYGFAVGDHFFVASTGFTNPGNTLTDGVITEFPAPGDMRVPNTNLTVEAAGASVNFRISSVAATGKVYQCPQAFSYIGTLTILNIVNNVPGDLIRIGHHQPRATGNQVRYAIPFKMKSADSFLKIYDRSDLTEITKNIQLANGTFTMDVAEAAAGTHRFTGVFDPRAMER